MSCKIQSLSEIAQCICLMNKVVVSCGETKQIRGLAPVADTSLRMGHELENVELLQTHAFPAWVYILGHNGMANLC